MQVADDEFVRLTDPYRRELLVHCYRMLGSVHDAEDLVQETYLRAWRGYDAFEGRSSLRTWLYRIATRACLTALEGGQRRVLPSGLGAPSDDPDDPLPPARAEVAWLQPLPDTTDGSPTDPASIAGRRESTRLALVVALQLLPARRRAVLILRDVLGWKAAEVAKLLDTTTTAVNSQLLRARAQVARLAPDEEDVEGPAGGAPRAVLERYVAAFQNADVTALVDLLRADVELEMPPIPIWFSGHDAVIRFLGSHLVPPGSWRLVPVSANGQPAALAYLRDDDGQLRAQALHVLTVSGGRISRITSFVDAAHHMAFGLPPVLPESPATGDEEPEQP